MTSTASSAPSVPLAVLTVPEVVKSALPLGLKEEISKATACAKSSLDVELGDLKKQVAGMQTMKT